MTDFDARMLPVEALIATQARGTRPIVRSSRKATVVNDFDAVTNVAVIVDGDTKAARVMSKVGQLQAGQRVMVDFVRPHGAYVTGLIVPAEWRPIAYAAGWSDLGFGFRAGEYRRVDDEVQLRGVCKGPATTTITTLPTGFVPSLSETFDQDCSPVAADHSARVDVLASGVVVHVTGGAPAAHLSLSGIRFSITDAP